MQFIAAGTTIKLIITLIAGELILVVVIIAGIKHVIACATMQLVFALARIKLVITAGESCGHSYGIIAIHGVITIIAMHLVMPGLTGHPVIACATIQRIVARALHALLQHQPNTRRNCEIRFRTPPFPGKGFFAGNRQTAVQATRFTTIRKPAPLNNGTFGSTMHRAQRYRRSRWQIIGIAQNQVIPGATTNGVVTFTSSQNIILGAANDDIAAKMTIEPVAAFTLS